MLCNKICWFRINISPKQGLHENMLSPKHTGFESFLIFFDIDSFSEASNMFVIDAVEEVKEK